MKKGIRFLTNILLIILLIQVFTLPLFAAREDGIYGDQITFITADSAGGETPAEKEITEIVAEGNGLIIYDELEISAEHIRYLTASEDIFLKGGVVLLNPDYRIEGEDLTGNLGKRDFSLDGGVKLSGSELLITATSMNYQLEADRAVFEGDVNLKYQTIAARAERVRYNSAAETAFLEGNVEGERDGYHFSGESLLIDLSKDNIILKGDGSRARMLFSGDSENKENQQ